MIVEFLAVAAVSTGSVPSIGPGDRVSRPIATVAPYPRAMADDVRRPGFNGRLWVGRPILGGMQQGPYPLGWESPGPEAYGAFDSQDASVPARIGHLVVEISPWESINTEGLKRYEAARNFWLQEQGYTGGVRTFVNDLYVWTPEAASAPAEEEKHVAAPAGPITPRATIQLPADMPRQRRRLRVDAGAPGGRELAALPGAGPVRTSWPAGAPAEVVARAKDRELAQPVRVITKAE